MRQDTARKKFNQPWIQLREQKVENGCYTFYSTLYAFPRKHHYCNEMEDIEDSLTACRDNDHETVAIISQAVSEVI